MVSMTGFMALLAFAAFASQTVEGAFNILTSPNTEIKQVCKAGVAYEVFSFPSSPWVLQPFQHAFKNPPRAQLATPTQASTADRTVKGDYYHVTIGKHMVDEGIAQCNGQLTPMLLFNGTFPGPLFIATEGRQVFIRWDNQIPVNDTDFPSTEKPWYVNPEYVMDICKERTKRTGHPVPGKGRGVAVHHHGMNTVASSDGFAEDVFCAGESKVQALSSSVASTFWYHAHALGITSEDNYNGLQGVHIVRPCKNPYGLTGIATHVMQLNDVVYDSKCHLLNDRPGVHRNFIYGDINLVNGVRWPVLATPPQWTRFRIVNASPSRYYNMVLRNGNGTSVGNNICKIVGSDGGFFSPPASFPPRGLLLSGAYRWDVVCDFSALDNQVLYWTNNQKRTEATPFFCFSHLLMKIVIKKKLLPGDVPGDKFSLPINFNATQNRATRFRPSIVPPGAANHAVQLIGPTLMASLKKRALKNQYDRVVKFETVFLPTGPMYVVNGKGWDYATNETDPLNEVDYTDVGQTTTELWRLEAQGVHPIHLHLVQFVVLAINGAAPSAELVNAGKDVVHVGEGFAPFPDRTSVTIAATYGPNIGEYMLHCHNSVHEDRDMMRAFIIRNATTGLMSMTAYPKANLMQNQGAVFGVGIAGGNVTSRYAVSTASLNAQTPAAILSRYLNSNIYDVMYPTGANSAALKNYTDNPWLSTKCG